MKLGQLPTDSAPMSSIVQNHNFCNEIKLGVESKAWELLNGATMRELRFKAFYWLIGFATNGPDHGQAEAEVACQRRDIVAMTAQK